MFENYTKTIQKTLTGQKNQYAYCGGDDKYQTVSEWWGHHHSSGEIEFVSVEVDRSLRESSEKPAKYSHYSTTHHDRHHGAHTRKHEPTHACGEKIGGLVITAMTYTMYYYYYYWCTYNICYNAARLSLMNQLNRPASDCRINFILRGVAFSFCSKRGSCRHHCAKPLDRLLRCWWEMRPC